MTKGEFLRQYDLDPSRSLICLLPGSRDQEVARHLPRMLAAARLLREKQPVQFVLVRAATVGRAQLERALPGELQVCVVESPAYDALAASDVAVISSGTATVEAALLETSMVVVYRVAPLTWWVGRWLVHTPYYSMVNLIAGQRVVCELIQHDFTPERVAQEVSCLLTDTQAREVMKDALRRVREQLATPGAIERASRAILPLLPRSAATAARC